MTPKKYAFMRYFLFLFGLVLLSSCNTNHKRPEAIKGVMVLSDHDFNRNGNLSLDGEWEFYWKKLIPPDQFAGQNINPDTFIKVRGIWNGLKIGNEVAGSTGYATYRLKIIAGKCPEKMGLKLKDMSSAYRLWINNELIAFNGTVSDKTEKMVPQYKPAVKTFKRPGDTFFVTIQVANNFHKKGGIWESIIIGTDEGVQRQQDAQITTNVFFLGTFFILCFYHLIIFIIRRKEMAAFWFGIICLIVLSRISLTGWRALYFLFPDFPLEIGFRIEYSFALIPWVFSRYFVYLFPDQLPKILQRFIFFNTMAMIAVIYTAPSQVYTGLLLYFNILVLTNCVLLIYAGIRAVINKSPLSGLSLFSMFVILVFGVNDILNSHLTINTEYISPFGFLLFFVIQAYILARNIGKAYVTIEHLSVSLKEANSNLERKVELRTRELALEKKKADDLLLNILPGETAAELKEYGYSKPRIHENVSVMFTDFKDFTMLSESITPDELLKELDYCFGKFDDIIQHYGMEKIKTVGDAYMCACGLPRAVENHASKIVSAAFEFNNFIFQRKTEREKEGLFSFEMRTGISSGPVVAGIVGKKKFIYDIWGDTVNTAARMEQQGEAGKINISENTYLLIKDQFLCEPRGKLNAKGKGEIEMYFVNALKAQKSSH